jgi:Lipase (class 3)
MMRLNTTSTSTTTLLCHHFRRFRAMPLLLIFLHTFTIVIIIANVSAQQSPNNTRLKWIGSTSILPLTKVKVDLIAFSGILSASRYLPGFNVTPGFGEKCYSKLVNRTGGTIDEYCTFDKDSYCFVYFKGSQNPGLSIEAFNDWILENANSQKQYVTKIDDPTRGCMVHKGFYMNYKGPGLAPMKNFVRTCMANGTRKQLVFTGHSQGAGAAGVASVAFADYNPLMIGLATPAFLTEPTCPLLNPKRIWRMINTENSDNFDLQYDPVSFLDALTKTLLPGFLTDNKFHVGEALFLPPNNEKEEIPSPPVSQVLYRSLYEPEPYGTPTAIDIIPDNGAIVSAHRLFSYLPKLLYLMDSTPLTSFPLNVLGFVDGTQCQENFECRSYHYTNNTTNNSQTIDGGCILNRCRSTRQSIGQKCRSYNDCTTRKCKITVSTSGRRRIRRECVPRSRG